MSKLLMYPHSGSGNHGCEAIIRSTKILFQEDELVLFSDNETEDRRYAPSIEMEIGCATKEIKRWSFQYVTAKFRKLILKEEDAFLRTTFVPLLKKCSNHSLFLSIGGDLYCYEAPEYIYRVNEFVRNKGCKTVLWGCSVTPSYIDDRMKRDLEQYDLICARESITYAALRQINPNTILTVDPAFVLPMEQTELPAQKYIGVNISPMAQGLETVKGITKENYRRMIQYILDNTDYSVALIPHVVWASNDDRVTLQELKDCFEDNERVVMVADHNAVQQKYIIAHCKIFVGARTHATIAAYSSCVPTLVVGYSVKAQGIAKDLFGKIDGYVLPVQSLKEPNDLTNAFCWLLANEDSIRKHLEEIMPEYSQRTQIAVQAVKELENKA